MNYKSNKPKKKQKTEYLYKTNVDPEIKLKIKHFPI